MSDIESRWRAAMRDSHLKQPAQQQLPVLALYPLVAVGDTPPAWLTQNSADGAPLVPCFLSEASARNAAQGRAQVVRAAGREFLESLGESTLWLDPGVVNLILSPEQVRAILCSVPAPMAIGTDRTLATWTGANDLPSPLRAALADGLSQFATARSAYWLMPTPPGHPKIRRMVVLCEPGEDFVRMMDAMAQVVRANYSGDLRIESQAMTQGEVPEAETRLTVFPAFYSRAIPR